VSSLVSCVSARVEGSERVNFGANGQSAGGKLFVIGVHGVVRRTVVNGCDTTSLATGLPVGSKYSSQRTASCARTCPARSGSPTPSGAPWLRSANVLGGSVSRGGLCREPERILGWYGRLIAPNFDGSKHRSYPGRPRVSREIEALIVRMAQERQLGLRPDLRRPRQSRALPI